MPLLSVIFADMVNVLLLVQPVGLHQIFVIDGGVASELGIVIVTLPQE